MPSSAESTQKSRVQRVLVWCLRALVGLIVLLILLGVVGAVWQRSVEAKDRAAYPPPGELVNIGTHALHLHCTGEGTPTVVLDTVSDGISSYWVYVRPGVAAATRVCTYDRSGFGWSEAGAEAADGATAAQELHALLTVAGEEGPYLLTGHSYGANIARLFWSLYSEEVAGIVLVDPGTLYLDARLPASMHEDQKTGEMIAAAGRWLSPVGLFRLSEMGLALTASLPEQQQAEFNAFFSAPDYWNALRKQNAAYPETSRQVAAILDMGDVPLLVLNASEPAGRVRDAWNRVNGEVAALSTNGEVRNVDGATHVGLVTDPQMASVTTDAILEMVDKVRLLDGGESPLQ